MAFPFPPDLQQFVRDQMASGKYASEEELLRDAFLALAEEEEDVAAVREAVAQWQAGDPGIPLDEAVQTIRRKHGIPSDA
ncbi:MAG: type II toxin-antitoxin system ParD family antitoxin [Planctomycetota bacterium]